MERCDACTGLRERRRQERQDAAREALRRSENPWRRIRGEIGCTQAEMAAAIGLTRQRWLALEARGGGLQSRAHGLLCARCGSVLDRLEIDPQSLRTRRRQPS